MNRNTKTRRAVPAAQAVCLVLAAILLPASVGQLPASETAATKIAIVVGPSNHAPGTHEVAAGGRLLAYCLEKQESAKPVRAEVYLEWPGKAALDDVATIVFIGDLFPPECMENPEKIKTELAALMDKGCGMVCLHFATGIRKEHMPPEGEHPLVRWIGGCFYGGVAKIVTTTLAPAKVDHPALRGWKAFTFHDEPYWNNYFGEDGPTENVTPLAIAMLPPDKPVEQTVAWAIERSDGGRGAGLVIPHFFRNWRIDDMRMLVLNAICWTAKLEIPEGGIQSTLPDDLSVFEPEAVEP